jgi:integrase
VPLIPALRELLMEQYLTSGQPVAEALVAPGRGGAVVTDDAIYRRRDKAWAGLKGMPDPPLRLHEARHTYPDRHPRRGPDDPPESRAVESYIP